MGQWRVRVFDRKFGRDFLAGVPLEPGIYRLYDAAGALIYVGKARSLRRRLAQYRTARRTKKDRTRRALVRSADRIEWQVCASELEASLTEVSLIQTLRPRRNIAAAFSFLYPFIGIQIDGPDTRFCLTTSPEAFAAFDVHGAFRSRAITREAFFALMRLFRLVAHPAARRRSDRRGVPRYSHVYTFRRFPRDWPELWSALLRGASRTALEELSLRLLDHARARVRGATIEADLRAVARFFDAEASTLGAAIAATGYAGYPVPQRDRDALFLRYRDATRTSAGDRGAPRSRALVDESHRPTRPSATQATEFPARPRNRGSAV